MRTEGDQLGKQLLRALLVSSCTVQIEQEVAHDPQTVDVVAIPHPLTPPEVAHAGLVARLIEGTTLFEPFRNTIGPIDLFAAERRQLAWHHEQIRGTRRWAPRPRTWVLSPGAPETVRREYGFAPASGFPSGLYVTAPGWSLGIVVLSELPRERDTLPLRLLAREATLRHAVEDLRALPPEDPLRLPLWDVLLRLRASAILSELETDEQEAWMLTDVQFEEFKQKLVQDGKSEGLREAVLSLCEVLNLPADEARLATLRSMQVEELEALLRTLKQTRRWD